MSLSVASASPLPIAARPESENPFALARAQAGGALPPILVVATDGTARGGVERRLGEAFEVAVVETQAAALERLRERRFALALLDVRNPGRPVRELARELREHDAELSVIVLGAGRGVKVIGEQCLQVPFDSPDLVELAHHEVEMAQRRRGRSAVIREMEGVIELLQRELAAKDSLADYGEASASMVHDLKNALFSTLGYTARLLQETAQLKDAVGDRAAQPIDQIARKLEQTSNYLFHLAQTCRFSDGAKPVEERLDLQAEIEHVHGVLFFHSPKLRIFGERQGAAGSRDVGGGPMVSGDRYELHRVFQNLFKNAFEAGAEDVQVTLRTRGDWIVAEIADDGRGFSDEDAAVALSKPLASSKRGGQGLGLRICRQIVERHRGTITLRSSPGEGAVFTLALPRAR